MTDDIGTRSRRAALARAAGALLVLALIGAGALGWLRPAMHWLLLAPRAFCG